MLMRRLIFLSAGVFLVGSLSAAPTHSVQKGETFYQIAQTHGTTPQALMQANPSVNPSRLHPGDILQLPPSPTSAPASTFPPQITSPPQKWVKVKKGDTLAKIAREHGITLAQLRQWNSLSGDTLQPAQILRLLPPASAAPKNTPPPPTPKILPSAPPQLTFLSPIRAQIDAPRRRLRPWEYIVIHHSGTSGGNAAIFNAYHRERGMENGMAYHFVIGNGSDSGDGQIEVGRRWLEQIQGGHLASESLNEIAIGICLVGDFTRHQPDRRQIAACTELVLYLRQLSPSPRLKFRLHREINTKPTECPGKLFPSAQLHQILD